MSTRPQPPDPALPERLAEVVPIDLARLRARQRREAAARAEAPAAAEDRDARGRELLAAAVAGGRLSAADLFAMVRLGILTDDVGLLPCDDRHRRENARDWERRYLEVRGQVPLDHPPASQVGCPIMAQAASAGAPACIEALRHRAQIPLWRLEGGFARRPLDEDDPVVRGELRPCLLLSRELIRHLLAPLLLQEPR